MAQGEADNLKLFGKCFQYFSCFYLTVTQVEIDYGSNIVCYSDFVVSEVKVKFSGERGAGATVIETFPLWKLQCTTAGTSHFQGELKSQILFPLKNTFGYKQGLSVEVDGTLCSDHGSSTFNGITEVAFECTGDLQGDVKIQRAADSYGFRCAIANETRMTCATSTSF